MTLVMWGVIKNNFGEELFWEKKCIIIMLQGKHNKSWSSNRRHSGWNLYALVMLLSVAYAFYKY